MMGWYNDSVGWGGWILMSLAMVVFWGLVIFAVVAIFRSTSKDTERSDRVTRPDPMQILDERFARGEIDVDDYHARREVLRTAKNDGPPSQAPERRTEVV